MASGPSRIIAVNDYFDTFDKLQNEIREFGRSIWTLFIKGDSKKFPSDSLENEILPYKYVDYVCKRGGIGKQRPSKSRGIRRSRSTLKCGCPVRIRAIACKKADGTQAYKISVVKLDHNHSTSELTSLCPQEFEPPGTEQQLIMEGISSVLQNRMCVEDYMMPSTNNVAHEEDNGDKRNKISKRNNDTFSKISDSDDGSVYVNPHQVFLKEEIPLNTLKIEPPDIDEAHIIDENKESPSEDTQVVSDSYTDPTETAKHMIPSTSTTLSSRVKRSQPYMSFKRRRYSFCEDSRSLNQQEVHAQGNSRRVCCCPEFHKELLKLERKESNLRCQLIEKEHEARMRVIAMEERLVQIQLSKLQSELDVRKNISAEGNQKFGEQIDISFDKAHNNENDLSSLKHTSDILSNSKQKLQELNDDSDSKTNLFNTIYVS